MPTTEIVTHTPGPWRVEPDLSSIGKGGVQMSTGNCIGTADDCEHGYLLIADARLIAAAPEMLAALKAAVEGSIQSTATGKHYIDSESLLAIRTAIAKAEPPAPRESAQPCGCDPGANWTCEAHRTAGAL